MWCMYTRVILDSWIKFTPLVWRENNFQSFYYQACWVPAFVGHGGYLTLKCLGFFLQTLTSVMGRYQPEIFVKPHPPTPRLKPPGALAFEHVIGTVSIFVYRWFKWFLAIFHHFSMKSTTTKQLIIKTYVKHFYLLRCLCHKLCRDLSPK